MCRADLRYYPVHRFGLQLSLLLYLWGPHCSFCSEGRSQQGGQYTLYEMPVVPRTRLRY